MFQNKLDDLITSLRIGLMLFWTVSGLYFGVGGYMAIQLDDSKQESIKMPKTNIIIDDVQYDNYEEYVWFRNRELVQQLFPWLTPVPQVLAVIITALAFGILGGVTRITKQLAFESEITIANAKIITLPVLGMLSGVIMLGLTFIVPTILTSGDQELRPTTLVFLTLFAGLFAKRFYDWLNSIFDIIFPNQKPKDS